MKLELSDILLLAFLASLIATILASEIPGAWWQWALTTIVLLLATAAAANGEDDR